MTLAEAEEKLHQFAAASTNELYVKDLQLGSVVANANAAEGTSARSRDRQAWLALDLSERLIES
jgi:hypothetical protein